MLRFFVHLFILAGSFGFSLTMRAQHCGFDGVYLLGIVPYDQDSSDILSDLEITLVDGKGILSSQEHQPFVSRTTDDTIFTIGSPFR